MSCPFGMTCSHRETPVVRHWPLQLCGGLFLLTSPDSLATVTVRDPGLMVVDRAGVLDRQTVARIEDSLRELERRTTAQVKVLTVRTTQGEALSEFCTRHGNLWKLGRADKDNGVLICLAVEDRVVWISWGLGLEATLPDSWGTEICAEAIQHHLSDGRYSDGIAMLADTVADRLVAEARLSRLPSVLLPAMVAWAVLVAAALLYALARKPLVPPTAQA